MAINNNLAELAKLFLKLGTIGFGGPPAHMAMMNREAVLQRQWLTPEEFSDGLVICEMLPGPASTQMGIYTGYVRAGYWGGIIAGLCFIAPAFILVTFLSWLYFRFQGLPQLNNLFFGISPVVTAIVLAFCWKLGKKTVTDWQSALVTIAVFCLTLLLNINILAQFIAAGIYGLFRHQINDRKRSHSFLLPVFPVWFLNLPSETLSTSSILGLERIPQFFLPLFILFLQIGSFTFGGGLVIIPLIESIVVDRYHWLTNLEFINGVAIGQITPGPVVITAAFIGYKVAGFLGALTATIAIFAPSFIFILLAAPLLEKLRQNQAIKAFLKGVSPAVLGAIAAATMPLAKTALVFDRLPQSIAAFAIFILASIAILRYEVDTWKLVLGGAIIGSTVKILI
jgi:chromate transporter